MITAPSFGTFSRPLPRRPPVARKNELRTNQRTKSYQAPRMAQDTRCAIRVARYLAKGWRGSRIAFRVSRVLNTNASCNSALVSGTHAISMARPHHRVAWLGVRHRRLGDLRFGQGADAY